MNKILVSDSINLENGIYHLKCETKKINIIIEGQVTIYLINEVLDEININMKEESELNLYKFNSYKENNLEVNINQNNNSKLNYNESFLNKKNNYLKINNYIKGNNNESNINIRNICNDEESKIIINMDVLKNTFNNVALENLKGINNGGFIHIEPNIICESNEINANHLTTIGSVDKDSLDYLMSKGIKKDVAINMLLNSFIYSNMDEYIKNFGGD